MSLGADASFEVKIWSWIHLERKFRISTGKFLCVHFSMFLVVADIRFWMAELILTVNDLSADVHFSSFMKVSNAKQFVK